MKDSTNGELAYENTETRYGVPLDYIREKLLLSVKDVHDEYQRNNSGTLYAAFRNMMKAYLGLVNMLDQANPHDIFEKYLAMDCKSFELWIDRINVEGDIGICNKPDPEWPDKISPDDVPG